MPEIFIVGRVAKCIVENINSLVMYNFMIDKFDYRLVNGVNSSKFNGFIDFSFCKRKK